MRILAVVPARGGSKGVLGKNIILLNGRPLISYTLDALRESRFNVDHIVSTDSDEIAEVARSHGGNVPFVREASLATDEANVLDVVFDVLDRVNADLYTHVLLLQPTCPLRVASDIDNAINLAMTTEAESVCSFTKVESGHLNYMYRMSGDSVVPVTASGLGAPRQEYEELLLRNGAIYLVSIKALREKRSFVVDRCAPYIMPVERSVNIDNDDDLNLAGYYLAKGAREIASIGI